MIQQLHQLCTNVQAFGLQLNQIVYFSQFQKYLYNECENNAEAVINFQKFIDQASFFNIGTPPNTTGIYRDSRASIYIEQVGFAQTSKYNRVNFLSNIIKGATDVNINLITWTNLRSESL